MAFAAGGHNPPAFSVGIDVMKAQVPARDTVDSFIAVFEEQLTALEKSQLTPEVAEQERVKRFFWMWTVKEAYTKALGIGLGYDFRRVEFDSVQRRVRIDEQVPNGWKFTLFEVVDGEDLYEGVTAEFVGGVESGVHDETGKDNSSWLTVEDAASVLRRAADLPSISS
ncbi:hypothetical protein NMY22_g5612 [Coprinellus aureogranulatus]|nr:hypothetical protein NMY22_g5612 [Coprinellus aureogranulatus]